MLLSSALGFHILSYPYCYGVVKFFMLTSLEYHQLFISHLTLLVLFQVLISELLLQVKFQGDTFEAAS